MLGEGPSATGKANDDGGIRGGGTVGIPSGALSALAGGRDGPSDIITVPAPGGGGGALQTRKWIKVARAQ